MSSIRSSQNGDNQQKRMRKTLLHEQPSVGQRQVDDTFFDWKGDKDPTHEPDLFTIAFQNIHGITSRQQSLESKISELINNMPDLQISALCLSEHQLALSNHTWRQRLFDALKAPSGSITAQFDSGPEYDQHGKLYGGTGIIMRNDATGRLIPGGKGGDKMGRWSYMHLRRKNRPPLSIIIETFK